VAKLLFTNDQSKPIGLTLEPWAQHDIIPARSAVEFEFNDAPAPELQFTIRETGDVLIYLNTEYIKIRINGEVRDFGYGERAPSLAPLTRW
jgi:hypothetical protein